MNLNMHNPEILSKYKSNAQRIRVLSENWAENNMFCPLCFNPKLKKFTHNTPVRDFYCEKCNEHFQLKSHSHVFGKNITGAAFSKIICSIREKSCPNFLFLQYNPDYSIENLWLIPSVFFIESIIQERKALSNNARRKGWIGCNILISNIPPEGRIVIISEGKLVDKSIISKNLKNLVLKK